MAFPWSDHWHSELKKMLAEGLKTKDIATRLTAACGTDCSRNAVIGKINRLGIAVPTPSSITRLERKEEAAAVAEARAQIERERVTQPEGHNNVHIFGLHPHHCRYPVAGTGRDTVFCGEKKAGESYCEYHHEICSAGVPVYRAKSTRLSFAQQKRAPGAMGTG